MYYQLFQINWLDYSINMVNYLELFPNGKYYTVNGKGGNGKTANIIQ